MCVLFRSWQQHESQSQGFLLETRSVLPTEQRCFVSVEVILDRACWVCSGGAEPLSMNPVAVGTRPLPDTGA
jgi:hypothetical protein